MRLLSALVAAGLLIAADTPELVKITGGNCPIGESLSHIDVHKAKISEFLIGKYAVTNAEYLRFIDDTGHAAPERNSLNSKHRLWTGKNFPPEIAKQPVVNVSWTDATAYCLWLSRKTGRRFRLPTEEEWDLAARGGLSGKAYPTGDAIDQQSAWYGQKWQGGQTIKDADYGKPNGYGLYGMAGNVWQWVEDWYVPIYDMRPVTEELNLYRVIRGGSWANEPDFLKLSYRSFHPPEFRDLFIGFRVACDAGQP